MARRPTPTKQQRDLAIKEITRLMKEIALSSDKQLDKIDNRTLDDVPVGPEAEKDFQNKAGFRNPFDAAAAMKAGKIK